LTLSVVVPTRNRPDQIGACVESVLACPEGGLELVVVDQSDSDDTGRELGRYAADRRLRHIRSDTRGASNARNLGIAHSRAPLLAFTDDDCRVPVDWASRILRHFEDAPEVSLVFGSVRLPETYAVGGFGAQFEPTEREFQHRLPAPDTPWGISANMSVRRAVVARIGGFDQLLGPGALFPAGGEDTDFMIRAVAAGFKIVNAREVAVLHLGVREGAEAARLVRNYGLALGATFAKHMRLGTRYGGAALLRRWAMISVTRSALNLLTGRRPTGFGFTIALLTGALRSLRHSIDQESGTFVPPATARTLQHEPPPKGDENGSEERTGQR
jgi:glycosyltransferase involved in cell wall biosynthesis